MEELNRLRGRINEVDSRILLLLADRAKLCEAIGSAKRSNGLPVKDAAREAEVYRRVREEAANLGLDPVGVEAVYREIVNMCSSVQE